MTEIDNEHFCSQNIAPNCVSECNRYIPNGFKGCAHYHRKWPTPELFEQEYGFPVPDGQAYYVYVRANGPGYWTNYNYSKNAEIYDKVIACTLFGPPSSDWKSENGKQ